MISRPISFAAALVVALMVLLPLTAAAVPLEQPKIPHSLDGRSECTNCHTLGGDGVGKPGGIGMPADHQGRTSAMCSACHQASATPVPATAATPAAKPTTAPAPTVQPVAAATVVATPAPAAGASGLDTGTIGVIVVGALIVIGIVWGVSKMFFR